MVLTRALTKRIGRVLIGVFAFAQITVAAFACPAPVASTGQASAIAGHNAMPDCDHVDSAAANLCSEHCKFGQQSSNPAPTLDSLPPAATLLYMLPSLDEALAEGIAATPPDPLLAAAPPPSHAILHCVLRI
jgi:hypothetical protein